MATWIGLCLRLACGRTLDYLCNRAQQEHGFFYHFIHSATGERIWKSEASSIDSAFLLCGALQTKAYWDDAEIKRMASELLNRADWQWMLNGGQLLSHGWVPESGFLPYRWDAYSELLAMYLLALSSDTHPIPASCWNSWRRPMSDYEGIFFIDAGAPLFVHQYSHAWFDFRDRVDHYANYFNNSQRATQAHRLYCMSLSQGIPVVRSGHVGRDGVRFPEGLSGLGIRRKSARWHAGALRRGRLHCVPSPDVR